MSFEQQNKSLKYMQALAAIKLCEGGGIVDLTQDDFEFLTQSQVWVASQRSRVRRCIESCVYGALDMVGVARFPAPAEFIAGVIAFYVHPVNQMVACSMMEGFSYSDNVITGVEEAVKPSTIFAHVCHINAGIDYAVEDRFAHVKKYLPAV